jgi:hypothetical protein
MRVCAEKINGKGTKTLSTAFQSYLLCKKQQSHHQSKCKSLHETPRDLTINVSNKKIEYKNADVMLKQTTTKHITLDLLGIFSA